MKAIEELKEKLAKGQTLEIGQLQKIESEKEVQAELRGLEGAE